jgi:hypothetical protein
MKNKLFLPVVLLSVGLLFCSKENNNYKSAGIILGGDPRMCICCGGWYIKIDTITYEFDTLPENTNINLQKDTFPINVKLDWSFSEKTACPDKRITIQRITKE